MLLLEATLDNQTLLVGKRTARTQFGEQELGNVLVGTLHALADLGKIGENSLLVAFAHTLWGRDLVALCAGAGEVGMLRVEEREEAVQEEVVRDGSRRVVLPDAGALHHVALLYFGFGGSDLLLAFGLVSAGGSELGLEVVFDLLLARLLLFLQCSKVALCAVLVLAFLLLARLLLLLWFRQWSFNSTIAFCALTFFARSANISVTSSTSLSSPTAIVVSD